MYSNYNINLKKGELKKRWKEQKLDYNNTTMAWFPVPGNIGPEYWPGVVAVHRPSAARSVEKRMRANIP